jgi:hypothetical protein
VWQWPKKVAPGGGKPSAAGGAPKAGAQVGTGNLVSGAKWFSQAQGGGGGLPDVDMVEPAEAAGAADEGVTVEEQRVKDDIASSRAMAKHCRQAAKDLQAVAVNSSLGEALADEIARQVGMAEQHEQAIGQLLEQQRSELPNEVQLEKKKGLLKSLKGGIAKADEEHRGLVVKAEALQVETTAKAEHIAKLREKEAAIEKEIQEVFGKMAVSGDGAPPTVQQVRPPTGRGDEFSEEEKLEVYAARTRRAEAALWAQQQQHGAALQAAVADEQNRAALARAAEAEAARSAEEAARVAALSAQPGSAGGNTDHSGSGGGKGASSGVGRDLDAKMAANMAARRKANAPYPECVAKGTQESGEAPSQGEEGEL